MATADEHEAYLAFERDANYLALHADELKAQYPDQWVAVLREAVVAHSDNIAEFSKQLRAIQSENETPASHFFSSLTQRWTRFPGANPLTPDEA
jgi:hypothetical protein